MPCGYSQSEARTRLGLEFRFCPSGQWYYIIQFTISPPFGALPLNLHLLLLRQGPGTFSKQLFPLLSTEGQATYLEENASVVVFSIEELEI